MKILHFNTYRELSEGQRKQLRYEQKAAGKFNSCTWKIEAFQIHPVKDVFERRYPRLFRSLFMRKLYAWIFLMREHSKYDVVLVRHIQFDPFVLLFGWLVRNRVTVHHAKEAEELRLIRQNWTGRAASLVEKITGYVSSRQVLGILGVTREISDYQLKTHRAECPAGSYPNGIDLDQVDILEDKRSSDIHIAFMCGKYSPWHGLDKLLDAASTYKQYGSSLNKTTFHLIGSLEPDQVESILKLRLKSLKIKYYGHMAYDDYRRKLACCDIGIDALSLDLKGLSEATTLKVREYLALGLPVYSGFNDSALPQDFPYFRKGPVEMDSIISYARMMKSEPRYRVREASAMFIQKYDKMLELVDWLQSEVLPLRKHGSD